MASTTRWRGASPRKSFPRSKSGTTPDGRPIKLSRDPNDRCTGGGSTGGIAAFTLAWERPDLFRRVFSAIGTFVGMRGGDRYPVLVRKTEPKPIRVFQQDGENDEWMGGPEVGDWWMGNQTLDRALEFAGYEHRHVWGTGPHSGKHATAIFPDAMRYLWKDWPEPVQAQTARTQNVVLKAILDPDSAWQPVRDAGLACDHLAVNPQGDVYFHDTARSCTRRLARDGTIRDEPAIPADTAFAFAADGRAVTVDGLHTTCVTVTSSGRIYATDADAGNVWLILPDGSKTRLDQGLKQPTGIGVSPDGLWLAVMERHTHWGYSYRVRSDGTVEWKQRFYWAHVPDGADDSGAGGLCLDRDGHLYLATHLGVQVFDRNGRSRGILPMPAGEEATSVCFGGKDFDTLFVASGGRLLRRGMKAVGGALLRCPDQAPTVGRRLMRRKGCMRRGRSGRSVSRRPWRSHTKSVSRQPASPCSLAGATSTKARSANGTPWVRPRCWSRMSPRPNGSNTARTTRTGPQSGAAPNWEILASEIGDDALLDLTACARGFDDADIFVDGAAAPRRPRTAARAPVFRPLSTDRGAW